MENATIATEQKAEQIGTSNKGVFTRFVPQEKALTGNESTMAIDSFTVSFVLKYYS